MFINSIISVAALIAVVNGQVSTGIYRIGNRQFFRSLAAQIGSNIGTLGGSTNNDAGVTWFITQVASQNAHTIQNVKSLQYMSIDGAPARGSIVVPRNSPFAWSVNTNTGNIGVNNLTFATLTSANLTLLPPGTDPSQSWDIVGIQPFPATYRIWNPATNAFLTGPSSLPGVISAAPLDRQDALQLWTVEGTGPANTSGSIANVKTSGFLSLANGTVGAFSTAKPLGQGWLFSVVGGGDRLSNLDAPSPNIIAIDSQGNVVADAANSRNQQVFVFVPADASNVHGL
ncbi:hypothetical protein AURDEDRAFT_187581 [Auricularia subglabra TFB-10046 SS5]|nr:hypothetical protein AURDEDRAFT_187581 [Auricularia subglabra TFB-10046 SS5]